jgi:tetratricopeptide (TPR) repeat protein
MGKHNQQDLLSSFVGKYFTEGEQEEFNSKFLQDLEVDGNGISLLNSGSDQVDLESFNSYYFNTKLDQLITYAEKKFRGNKLLSFYIYLGEFAVTNGEMDAAYSIYEKVIEESAKDSKFTDIQANAFLSIGEIYSRQAKWNSSIKFIKRALLLFRNSRNNKGLGRCENLLGTIYGDMGNITKAKEHFESAFNYLRNTRDLSLLGLVEINLGIINLMQEDFESAFLYLKRALVNYKQTGDLKRIAEIHYNTGVAYLKMEDLKCAISEFDSGINSAQQIGYLPLIALSYLSKAQVYLKQLDNALASAFADKSMEIAYQLNDRLSVAEVYRIKGVIQRNLNNFSAAENYLMTSLRINKEVANKYNYAETSFELGLLYKESGKLKESSTYFSTAKTYYKKIKAFNELKKVEFIMN